MPAVLSLVVSGSAKSHTTGTHADPCQCRQYRTRMSMSLMSSRYVQIFLLQYLAVDGFRFPHP